MSEDLKATIVGEPANSGQGVITGVPSENDPYTKLKESPYVKKLEAKAEIDRKGFIKNVLVVYTDIKLNCLDKQFNQTHRNKLEELAKTAFEQLTNQFDRIDIVQLQ